MIHLYHAGGASDFTLLDQALTNEQGRNLLESAERLLEERGDSWAATILRETPFRVMNATNHFGDEFCVLHAVVPLAMYEEARKVFESSQEPDPFELIGKTVSELGPYVRFLGIEMSLERPVHPSRQGLKPFEVKKLVYKYIGVEGGYLADFTYRSHQQFYVDLEIDVDPYDYDGTTRERFMKILAERAPSEQARILGGILERFPPESSESRTKDLAKKIEGWISRLNGTALVEQPELRITSEVVERALLDAQELIRSTGATSGVDRVHTALHGYLREVARSAGLPTGDNDSTTGVFKTIRERHSAFKMLGPRSDDVKRVIGALATIVDAANPLRRDSRISSHFDRRYSSTVGVGRSYVLAAFGAG